eukprot:194124-Chlamydomonas_euryale.AAC.1
MAGEAAAPRAVLERTAMAGEAAAPRAALERTAMAAAVHKKAYAVSARKTAMDAAAPCAGLELMATTAAAVWRADLTTWATTTGLATTPFALALATRAGIRMERTAAAPSTAAAASIPTAAKASAEVESPAARV